MHRNPGGIDALDAWMALMTSNSFTEDIKAWEKPHLERPFLKILS
jgi:hypothetical protein